MGVQQFLDFGIGFPANGFTSPHSFKMAAPAPALTSSQNFVQRKEFSGSGDEVVSLVMFMEEIFSWASQQTSHYNVFTITGSHVPLKQSQGKENGIIIFSIGQ